MPRHLRLGWIAVILALAFISRIHPLSRGLGQDELFTAVHFVQAGSMWTTMSSNSAFNNHIGYSVMARVSARLFGGSEWSLRLPALVLGLMSLYLFWIFSEPIITSFGALLGVLLLALSPPHVVWSVEARGYSAMIFFSILSSYFYFRLLRRPTRLASLGYVAANVFGIYVHLYSVFVVAAQGLLFLRLIVGKGAARPAHEQISSGSIPLFWRSFGAIAALSLIAYAPVLRSMLMDILERGRGSFDPTFPWLILDEFSGGTLVSLTMLITAISVLGLNSLRKSHPLESDFFIWLLALPLCVMWLLARPFDLYPRFFAFWLPFYTIFFVAGLQFLWRLTALPGIPIARVVPRFLAGAIFVTVLYSWTSARSQYMPDEGYREASAAALRNSDPNVQFCAIGGARSVWRYYIHQSIANPLSLGDLQKLTETGKELRCVYYEASWQSDEQKRIAQFLLRHAEWQRIKDLVIFKYQSVRQEESDEIAANLRRASERP